MLRCCASQSNFHLALASLAQINTGQSMAAWQDMKKYVPSEIKAKDKTSKKINTRPWGWIFSWQWRRNRQGDTLSHISELFHKKKKAEAEKHQHRYPRRDGVTLLSAWGYKPKQEQVTWWAPSCIHQPCCSASRIPRPREGRHFGQLLVVGRSHMQH